MANIINGSVIPFLQVGGRMFTDLSNLIKLSAFCNGVGNGYSTFRKENGGLAGYTPSGSKSFKLQALIIRAAVAQPAAAPFYIAQSDNDVGIASNTALTNAVYPAGNVLTGSVFGGLSSTLAESQIEMNFTIANGKYLSAYNNNQAGSFILIGYGYEV